MTSAEKELIATIKISIIRGIVMTDEEKLLEMIKTAFNKELNKSESEDK